MLETYLSKEELKRYMRHLMLANVGKEGQLRLKNAKVVIVGMGGLGCPVLMYLAAAGVGSIGIVDGDTVEESNLQRQILYSAKDIGEQKVIVAKRKIADINPLVNVTIYSKRLEKYNFHQILEAYDIVIDGSDNFATKYLVNDACVKLKKPLVYGSIFRFEGQVSIFSVTKDSPCYRCLYPEIPREGAVPDCSQAGVLGILPGTIAMFQATETLKFLLKIGDSLCGKLLYFHALDMEMRKISISKNNECIVCTAQSQFDIDSYDYHRKQVINIEKGITCRELSTSNAILVDVREWFEHHIEHIPQSIHIPLAKLAQESSKWTKKQKIIAYCKSGYRSKKAVLLLRDKGFKNVTYLEGGMLEYSDLLK